MNKINAFDTFAREGVNDPNNILKTQILKPISEAISLLDKGGNLEIINLFGSKLDKSDLQNLASWYEKYKILYSYSSDKTRILNENDESIMKSIKKSKGKFDLVNLVEISFGFILENYFEENVRIRKTSDYDDFKSGIDYIIEFLDKNNKVSKIIGIDLTLSNDLNIIDRKKRQKTTKPKDYLKYIKNKNNTSFDFIPRLVLHVDRDLAYSFTNNFFTQIIEKGDLLDKEEIDENFNYAVGDLKKILAKNPNTLGIKTDIFHLVEETKIKAKKLYTNY